MSDTGWIFQGNPQVFNLDDYLSSYTERIYWRTNRYKNDIQLGDRAFIWRARHKAGVIAIGRVVELPTPVNEVEYPDALGTEYWIGSSPKENEEKTGIQLEEIRLSPDEGAIPRDWLLVPPIFSGSMIIRAPNGTVFKLDAAQVSSLERLWGYQLLVGNVEGLGGDPEGRKRLVAHYVRERSTNLRNKKIRAFREQHGRLLCEICLIDEFSRYPSAARERIFEVHHRVPLSQASEPIKTEIEDLAVICANCHRTVHASKDVENNFMSLKQFFADQT